MTTTEVIKALRISDINIEEVAIGVKKNNKTIPILFKNKPLVFQTPFLEVHGTLRKTSFPNIYQLDTLFKGDTEQKIQQWYQFIENLEIHISNQIADNGFDWFTQKHVKVKELIRELDSAKEIYFVKWPIDLKTNIFIDEQKKSFNPSDLKDKDLVKLIIEISDLWINENYCGLAVIVQKILVKPYLEKIQSEYVFDDDNSGTEGSDINENENNIISLLATEQKTRSLTVPVPSQPIMQPQPVPNIITHTSTKKQIVTPMVQQPKFGPIINGGYEQNNKQHNLSKPKKDISRQNKLNLEQKSKNKHQSSKIIAKEIANPFKNANRQQSSLKEVFSDLSEDDKTNINNGNMHTLQQLVDEYSPLNEDDINDDDLDFD
jgi:hypothetical protein